MQYLITVLYSIAIISLRKSELVVLLYVPAVVQLLMFCVSSSQFSELVCDCAISLSYSSDNTQFFFFSSNFFQNHIYDKSSYLLTSGNPAAFSWV